MKQRQVLIVEDSLPQIEQIRSVVESAGFEPRVVTTLDAAKDALSKIPFSVLLTDIHLTASVEQTSFEGIALLQWARTQHPDVLCLAMSSDPNVATYHRALEAGALHFLRKPLLGADEFSIAVDQAKGRRALERASRLRTGAADLPDPLRERYPDGLVLDVKTRDFVRRIAMSRRLPVVLYGETGTGKEEIAKLIHRRRVEMEGALPFVAVNCANLDGDIAPSLIFGHKKGAFTGALETTSGYIGEANGGILFLDELHTLSLECQRRLLRVLNDGSYQRIGDTKTLHSEFQVVCASTKDLDDEVEGGTFLLDLRSRLTGIDLTLPPLRKRMGDIPALVSLFFAREGVAIEGEEVSRIAERCGKYAWKGNIRQLHKVLQSLVDMATFNGDEIKAENLPVFRSMVQDDAELSPAPVLGRHGLSADFLAVIERNFCADTTLETTLDLVERFKIQSVMARYVKLNDVADALGISRSSLDSKRKKYAL